MNFVQLWLQLQYHVNIHESHQKYLGFSTVVDGRRKWFKFVAMRFWYRDASRVITKVLRVPVHHGRMEGKSVYVHMDDGLEVSENKKEVEEAVKAIRKELAVL